MDRLVFTAMSGAKQSIDRQSVLSANLANVSTSGFRVQLNTARSVPVKGDAAHETRVSAVATTPGANFATGPIAKTGRDLDIAMTGNTWLAVQAPNGQEAYTRRGDLQIDADGFLVTGNGNPVIGDGGPIAVPPGAKVFIGENGVISNLAAGANPDELAPLGQLKLVEANGNLTRGVDGLFRPAPGANGNVQELPLNENARIATRSLEGSNVNPVEAMVAMIDNSRSYEMHMKVIQSSDENAQKANSLLSMS